MKKWTMIASIALVLLLGAASLTYARGGMGEFKRNSTGWVETLELNDTQISKIQSAIKDGNLDSASKMQAFHQKMGELRLLEWSKEYTEEKALALMEEMRVIREELQVSRKAGQEKIYNELTEEQRAKYNENCGQRGDGEGNPPRDGSGRRGDRGNRGGKDKPTP
jgi:Spy/CpxP family protein refolding chaperone